MSCGFGAAPMVFRQAKGGRKSTKQANSVKHIWKRPVTRGDNAAAMAGLLAAPCERVTGFFM